MTLPDNTSFAIRISERLAFFMKKDDEAATIIADRLADRAGYRSHIQELEWMREQLDPVGASAAAPETPAPAEIAPLDKCIAAIRATFMMPLNPDVSDRMAQGQLAKAGHKFKLPTVRRALIEIGKESRAGSTGEANPPSPSPTLEAADAGAGAGVLGDFPETPAYLRRAKQTQHEEIT